MCGTLEWLFANEEGGLLKGGVFPPIDFIKQRFELARDPKPPRWLCRVFVSTPIPTRFPKYLGQCFRLISLAFLEGYDIGSFGFR